MSKLSFIVPSFAKINWSLRILGRRGDGYHEVRTLLQTVSLHDELHFASRRDDTFILSCNDRLIPTDDNNLIVRAASALRDRFKISRGAEIRLVKRIPTKGGLGGASSNAAVTLLALAHLWNLEINLPDLIAMGARVGSDVPFFLIGGCALATGTGADVKAIPDDNPANTYLIVVTPKAAVATADAYRALRAPALTSTSGDSILSSSRTADILRVANLHNDFEGVIFHVEPEIERAKKALNDAGATGSLLAGSGSSVFGIFENEFSQARAAKEIQLEIGWRIFPVVTISRREYLRALGACGIPLYAKNNI